MERWRRDRDAENEAEDYRAALITSTILNTIPRTKATQHKVYQPWDIFPNYNWHGTQQTMTPDQFLQAWQGYGDVKIVELN